MTHLAHLARPRRRGTLVAFGALSALGVPLNAPGISVSFGATGAPRAPGAPGALGALGAWRMAQSTEPVDFENRPAFLARLRRCVSWLNEKQGDALLTACTNQEVRAKDVIKLKGAKTKW